MRTAPGDGSRPRKSPAGRAGLMACEKSTIMGKELLSARHPKMSTVQKGRSVRYRTQHANKKPPGLRRTAASCWLFRLRRVVRNDAQMRHFVRPFGATSRQRCLHNVTHFGPTQNLTNVRRIIQLEEHMTHPDARGAGTSMARSSRGRSRPLATSPRESKPKPNLPSTGHAG